MAMKDKNALVRAKGLQLLAGLHPREVVQACARVLEEGAVVEKQRAISVLADSREPSADEVLRGWMERLLAGKTPAEIRLDLVEASRRRKNPALAALLARYESTRSPGDPTARWQIGRAHV